MHLKQSVVSLLDVLSVISAQQVPLHVSTLLKSHLAQAHIRAHSPDEPLLFSQLAFSHSSYLLELVVHV